MFFVLDFLGGEIGWETGFICFYVLVVLGHFLSLSLSVPRTNILVLYVLEVNYKQRRRNCVSLQRWHGRCWWGVVISSLWELWILPKQPYLWIIAPTQWCHSLLFYTGGKEVGRWSLQGVWVPGCSGHLLRVLLPTMSSGHLSLGGEGTMLSRVHIRWVHVPFISTEIILLPKFREILFISPFFFLSHSILDFLFINFSDKWL